MPGAFCWIGGTKNITIDNFHGEGNTYGVYFHSPTMGGATYGIRITRLSSGGKPIYADGSMTIAGCMIDTSELLSTTGQCAITGASNFQGIWVAPNNRYSDTTKIADGYCGALGRINGWSVNHAKAPAANLDTKLLAFGVPLLINRDDDNLVYTQIGGPRHLEDGTTPHS